jgi:hypothetical protein
MRTGKTTLWAAIALLAGVAACSGETTGPRDGSEATPAEALPEEIPLEILALRIDGLDAVLVEAEVDAERAAVGGETAGPGEPDGEQHRHWVRTRACEMAGTVEAEGELHRLWNRQGTELATEIEATVRHMGCTFEEGGEAFQIQGEPGVELTAWRAMRGGEPDGVQWTRRVGAFSWQFGEKQGTCAIDVTTEADPSAATRTMSGELCGHIFTYRWEWGQESDS